MSVVSESSKAECPCRECKLQAERDQLQKQNDQQARTIDGLTRDKEALGYANRLLAEEGLKLEAAIKQAKEGRNKLQAKLYAIGLILRPEAVSADICLQYPPSKLSDFFP